MIKRFSANYVFTVNTPPLKNGIVEVDDKGVVQNIIDTKGNLQESRGLEFHNGVLTPGFINSHCHLELSDLKGEIEPKQGLPNFLSKIIQLKRRSSPNKRQAINEYDSRMQNSGIVAVGDVVNTNETIDIKEISKIYYHNFIELIGLGPNANQIFNHNKSLQKEFLDKGLKTSIVPHAPYSVSKKLFKLIQNDAEQTNSILSIHNQESEAENEMFISGNGKLIETFRKANIDLGEFELTGRNSLLSVLEYLPDKNNILLVHNTYTKKEDVELINQKFEKLFWCLCPSSNLHLENRLPDLSVFKNLPNVILGTDSLASNHSLSILNEMKLISQSYPDISFNTLIEWASINGARALKIEEKYGSLGKNKIPGLNLITNFDFERMQLTEKSEVKKLI